MGGAREGGPGPVLLTALASEALAKEGVDLDDRGRPLLIGTRRWMRASVAPSCAARQAFRLMPEWRGSIVEEIKRSRQLDSVRGH